MFRLVLLFPLVLLLLNITPARAQCEYSPWVTIWPNEHVQVIQPRQVILLSANSVLDYLPKEMRQIGYATQVYLWSAHDSVELVVKDRTVTDDNNLSLLLQPSRPLLPDNTYELRVRRNNENLFWIFRNRVRTPEQLGKTIYQWRVASAPDTQAPTWISTPTVVKKVFSDNSEGTENYVLFSCPLSDASSYIVKATVYHLRSGFKSTAYLHPWEGQLAVGWFTCGGDFRFASQEECTVLFEAIDAAGNRSSVSGGPIRFQAPVKGPTPWH